MADNLEPRVSKLEKDINVINGRFDNVENRINAVDKDLSNTNTRLLKLEKLEGKISRISANKISKKEFSDLGSKVALNQQKLAKITKILKAKGTNKKEGAIASLGPESGKNTLIKINESLISIKDQLELDYSSRINKEKRELKNAQKAADLKKRQKKEKDIESLKKVGGAIGGIVNKIGAPIKGIFDKILGFFGALVGGFVINQLLTPENIERVKGVFDALAKNWKWVVGIAGGVLILGVVRKLVKLFRAVRAIARFATGRGFGGGRGGRRGIASRAEQRYRRRFGDRAGNDRFGKVQKAKGGLIRNASGGVRNNIVAKSIGRVQNIASKAGSKIVSKIGLKGVTKFLRPLLKRIPIFGGLIDFAVSLALGEPIGRAAAKAVGAMLGGALGSLIPIPGVGTLAGGILGDIVGGKIYDFVAGAKNDEKQNKESAENAEKLNVGGQVPGNKNGLNVDSVSTMLTPGEFVLNRNASKFWGINTLMSMNALDSRMHNTIAKTFEKEQESIKKFEKINEKFAKILIEYEKLKESSSKPSPGGGSPGGGPPGGPKSKSDKKSDMVSPAATPPPAQISPTSSANNAEALAPTSSSNTGGGITVMPTQKQTSMASLGGEGSQNGGDSIPVLGAEDPSNFFIGYMKEQLGIFGA